MPTPITQCRICGNTDLELILQLGDQKLTGVFPATADEEANALGIERTNLHKKMKSLGIERD